MFHVKLARAQGRMPTLDVSRGTRLGVTYLRGVSDDDSACRVVVTSNALLAIRPRFPSERDTYVDKEPR